MLRHSKSGFDLISQQSPQVRQQEQTRIARRTISRALAENRLKLVYQPIVKATKPDFPAFFECLLRIEEPSGHLGSAGPFIPMIEDMELGRLVDRLVLRMAMRALEEHPHCRLSINVSAQSLGDAAWLDILATGCAGERLIVEITETSRLMHDDVSMSFFESVRKLGCSIAIDDFGAGYTSLANLRDFRFDMLKIDGSFIRGICKHKINQLLVEKTIEIAKALDLLVVAEWVETAEEAELLSHMGADCLQGFHFGQPVVSLPGETDWLPEARVSL